MSLVSLTPPDERGADVHALRCSVGLMDVDAGFAAAVPPEDRALARRVLTAPRHLVGAGRWRPDQLPHGGPRPFAALVLEGVVVKEVLLAGRASVQLLGPGDLLRPWETAETALPCSMCWSTMDGAAIAVLDERFVMAARRWPDLMGLVSSRLGDQLDNEAQRTAVCGLPRVEDRVLALFWQLADRWGVVRADGVVVRLALTHELIGRMIGAKRPTVSLALTTLAGAGHLTREPMGGWLLSHASAGTLTREVADHSWPEG